MQTFEFCSEPEITRKDLQDHEKSSETIDASHSSNRRKTVRFQVQLGALISKAV